MRKRQGRQQQTTSLLQDSAPILATSMKEDDMHDWLETIIKTLWTVICFEVEDIQSVMKHRSSANLSIKL